MIKRKRIPARKAKPILPPEAFDAIPRVALVLTDETMYVTRFSPRGEPQTTYPVTASDVTSALNQFDASTGLLPADVLFWQSRGGRDRLGIWLPPMVRALTFAQGRRDVTLHVPLPGFVFVGQGIQYHIFAATARPTKASEQLYHAPLPNVGPDGGICAGDVKFPKANAQTLPQAATLFWESHFNSDLSTDKIRSQIGADDDSVDGDDVDTETPDGSDIINMVREPDGEPRETLSLFQFLRGLERERSFPLDELVPAITVSQLLLKGGKNGND